MTHSRTDQPLTALTLLFGNEEDPPATAAGRALTPALRLNLKVPEAVRVAAAGAVAAAAAGLLGFDLIGLVVEGWREQRDLTAAARRTLSAPGSTELVRLASHRITATRQPYISVLVNGEQVATVTLELTLQFTISGLVAGVTAGRLTAVHAGRCDVSGTLAVEGVDVLTRWAQIDLPGTVSLREGIRLLPQEDYGTVRPGASVLPGESAA